jgi:hypothetical protein
MLQFSLFAMLDHTGAIRDASHDAITNIVAMLTSSLNPRQHLSFGLCRCHETR